MARTRQAGSRRRYRQPSLLNTLLFRLSLLSPFNPTEFPMPTSRRNLLVRTIGTLCADLAVGVAVASVAGWVIQTASLGAFLSFLLWMLSVIVALALSQYLVHPVAKVLLSDQKLDLAFSVLDGFAGQATQLGLSILARIKPAT